MGQAVGEDSRELVTAGKLLASSGNAICCWSSATSKCWRICCASAPAPNFSCMSARVRAVPKYLEEKQIKQVQYKCSKLGV